MATVVPKGAPDSRPLEVPDDQVDYWAGYGYVQVGGSAPAKKTAKKTAKRAAKKSS